jgi:hypothetical protein
MLVSLNKEVFMWIIIKFQNKMWKKNINTSKKILIISMGLINMNKCQRNKKMN